MITAKCKTTKGMQTDVVVVVIVIAHDVLLFFLTEYGQNKKKLTKLKSKLNELLSKRKRCRVA